MIKIEHLVKRYGDKVAVNDISFTVEEGEIVGFLGPNGAGKTTTMSMLTGCLSSTSGSAEINGINVLDNPIEAKKQIGYVSDNHAVFERLTGREYVNHIANLYRVGIEEMEERCSRLLKIFKLEEAFDRPIKSYSHGMKQKITVIAALVHNPKLWVLDEPLTGLDPQSAYQLKKVMKQHAKEGNTVFFSSHILDVVENLCDRCCIIEKGHLQGIYDLKELKAQGRSLERIFMRVTGEIGEDEEI